VVHNFWGRFSKALFWPRHFIFVLFLYDRTRILTTPTVGRALKEASLPIDGVRIDASKDEDGELSLFLKSPFVPLLTHPTGTPNNSNSGSTTPATNPHATNNTVTGGSGASPPAALTPAEALRTVDLVFRARTKGGELLCFILFRFFFRFCSMFSWPVEVLDSRGSVSAPPGYGPRGGVSICQVSFSCPYSSFSLFSDRCESGFDLDSGSRFKGLGLRFFFSPDLSIKFDSPRLFCIERLS
jgi:hypothetical protein